MPQASTAQGGDCWIAAHSDFPTSPGLYWDPTCAHPAIWVATMLTHRHIQREQTVPQAKALTKTTLYGTAR